MDGYCWILVLFLVVVLVLLFYLNVRCVCLFFNIYYESIESNLLYLSQVSACTTPSRWFSAKRCETPLGNMIICPPSWSLLV